MISLVIFGAETFKTAYLIQNLDKLKYLKGLFDKKEEKTLNELEFEKKEIVTFVRNHLIDSIKITIFFEIFFKSVLLDNNIIIHLIDKNKPLFKDIFKQQEIRPIPIKEYREIIEVNNINFESGLKNYTLPFNYFVKSHYKEPFNIPEDIFSTISNINKYRNELHLYRAEKFQISNKIIYNYENLNTFVDEKVELLKPYLNLF